MTSRIAATFERLRREGRTGVIPFVTAGFPIPEETAGLVQAMVDGGADIVELGVPFSDPLGEGPVIQASSQVALEAGMTPRRCLDIVRDIRHKGVIAPLVLMGYYNPILAYGSEAFARDAAEAGADGLIVVDLPVEEAGDVRQASRAYGLDLVPLIAPTSTDERIAMAARVASGFVYCVSVRGVTGVRDDLPADLEEFVGRVRRATDLPIAVGFGISKREHVEQVGRWADAAAIGSAIVRLLQEAAPGEREEKVRRYVELVAGRSSADVPR